MALGDSCSQLPAASLRNAPAIFLSSSLRFYRSLLLGAYSNLPISSRHEFVDTGQAPSLPDTLPKLYETRPHVTRCTLAVLDASIDES